MPHTCHAMGCRKPVAPRFFMCPVHWAKLPAPRKDAIWSTYRRGQEIDNNPSRAYLDAANAAIVWLAKREGKLPDGCQCPAGVHCGIVGCAHAKAAPELPLAASVPA